MPKNADLKQKLRATLEAKRIARTGLDSAYERLEEFNTQRERLIKEKKNVTHLDILIGVLREELDKIEEASANMQHGCNIDGGVGFGSGGGSGTDAG